MSNEWLTHHSSLFTHHMIAVIADDFTGAAELAGISLRYGLKVELCTGDVALTDADVLIVSTDSRSLNKTAALAKTAAAIERVLQLNPTLVYKKIDSVLRGYVLDELKLQMQLMLKTKAFILPANPTLGRTISNGKYYVQGKLISETGFAADPEFPISHSSVKSILKNETINVLRHTDVLPANGIVVSEAENETDVQAWAGKLDESFVLAGAGDFYTALLNIQFKEVKQQQPDLQLPFLYVCGTAYDQSVNYIKKVDEKNKTVLYITKQMIESGVDDPAWLQRCKDVLEQKQKAIIALNSDTIPSDTSAADLRSIMAKAVKAVVEQCKISELFIEGGSTATAILQELGIKKLSPVNELARGVVRMKAGELYITVKPGSYELSNEIKQLFK
ncbi:four-carbon acid sugar kinase family protein [Lacibacter sp. H375]|uniref:four-carbon acid sugar kinase family protein n=1 Tax=Lacibacter sp. H375 TaxID=3133424 RepID=UPI0030C13C19